MKGFLTGLVVLSLLLAADAWGETKVDPTLRLIAEQRYDDDILLRNDLTGRGELDGQLMTKVSPQLGLRVRDPLWTLKTFYALDAMYRETSGTTNVDHRAYLTTTRQLSHRANFQLDAQVWRVSDPTSLPRMGIARTLSPVLYGKASSGFGYMATERWQVHPSLTFEGAKVFEADSVPGYQLAPDLENWYLVTRRTSVGAEYRFQYLSMGPDSAHANGVFGAYRYRISRPWTFTARAGPVFYAENGGGSANVLPRATLELQREEGMTEFGAAIGTDLVGASGFSNALWAQYASLLAAWRVNEPLRLYGVGSFYRNGPAEEGGFQTLDPSFPSSSGYTAEVGAEWKFNRFVTVSGAFTRIAQVGTEWVNLSRNIGAVRLILTNVE